MAIETSLKKRVDPIPLSPPLPKCVHPRGTRGGGEKAMTQHLSLTSAQVLRTSLNRGTRDGRR